MRALMCGLLVTCLADQAVALGREVGYEEARERFANLRQVVECGTRQSGERIAELRLLRFTMYAQDLIFVDSVLPDDAGENWQVERGYGFVEINNDHAEIGFSRLSCSSDDHSRVTVEGLAENGHDQSSWKVRIDLDLDSGTYRYEAQPAE